MAKFTSFEEKADLLPTEQQVQCMSDLVKSLDLQSGSAPVPASLPVPGFALDHIRVTCSGCRAFPSLFCHLICQC